MEFIHSGSTLLNLCLTGRTGCGWPLGRVSNVVGDRSSGKTLIALEASTMFIKRPPHGVKPGVFYLESEAAFDESYAASLGVPTDEIQFMPVRTVEDFYEILEEICKSSQGDNGSLVVLDSLDALSSRSEMETKIDQGSYGTSKAKKTSELFRKLVGQVEKSNVHLMVISQVRQNITALPFAPKYTRSGGKALDFYCTHIVWLQETGKIKHSKTKLVQGINVKMKVSKNKVSMPYRDCTMPLLFGFGFDDVRSLIEYLASPDVPSDIAIKKKTGGRYILGAAENGLLLGAAVKAVEDDLKIYADMIERASEAWKWAEHQSRKDTVLGRKPKHELLSEDADG